MVQIYKNRYAAIVILFVKKISTKIPTYCFYIRGMSHILSLHYLPNIYWMRQLLQGNCIIDGHEYFVKQTYRNRTLILAANGVMPLTIPVKKTASKIKMMDLEPDNTVAWQRQHLESIKSAYGSASYFIHYIDAFEQLYKTPCTSIFEFELNMLKLIIKLLKVQVDINLSASYVEATENDIDLRGIITPKIKLNEPFKPYLQVFTEKFPFTENLSVLDVLFNHGPRANNFIL